jgi:hypothetical protein
MERLPHNTDKESNLQPTNQKQEVASVKTLEFVEKFKHIQEDLKFLFEIEVTSQTSLNYPWVKNELYAAVEKELKAGTPFALDYMFDEGLLTKEDLKERRIETLKPYAETILATFKGTRLTRAKELFIETGIFTE